MDGSKIICWVPSLHDHCLDPRAAIVLDLVPRASAHQADKLRLLNFIPGQSFERLNMDRGNPARRLKFERNRLTVTIFAQP